MKSSSTFDCMKISQLVFVISRDQTHSIRYNYYYLLTEQFLNSPDRLLLPAFSDLMQVINDALSESIFSLKLVESDPLDKTKKYCE